MLRIVGSVCCLIQKPRFLFNCGATYSLVSGFPELGLKVKAAKVHVHHLRNICCWELVVISITPERLCLKEGVVFSTKNAWEERNTFVGGYPIFQSKSPFLSYMDTARLAGVAVLSVPVPCAGLALWWTSNPRSCTCVYVWFPWHMFKAVDR